MRAWTGVRKPDMSRAEDLLWRLAELLRVIWEEGSPGGSCRGGELSRPSREEEKRAGTVSAGVPGE